MTKKLTTPTEITEFLITELQNRNLKGSPDVPYRGICHCLSRMIYFDLITASQANNYHKLYIAHHITFSSYLFPPHDVDSRVSFLYGILGKIKDDHVV